VAWAAQFTSVWTETSPNAGLTGTADITPGAPDGAGFSLVSNFSVTVGADICFTCAVGFTDDLSSVLFDTTTFLLKGHITGSFTGSGGFLHTFDLALTDPPAGSGAWTFTNVRVDNQDTKISTGTYTPATPVPEPGTLTLVATGMVAGIGSLVRSRQRKP